MTKRTNAQPGPKFFARTFVQEATRLVVKARALHRELDATPLTLVHTIGGGWYAVGDDALVGEGDDVVLSEAGKRLVIAAVSELDIRDRAKLLAWMQNPDDELPSVQPACFKVTTTLTGEAWTLKLSAHVRGSGVAIATMAGTLAVEHAA